MDLNGLETELSKAISWRKIELQQARDLAETATGIHKPYLCRAWVLIIAAHCDQYIKEASKLYMQFLRHNPRSSYDYWLVWLAFDARETMQKSNDQEKFNKLLSYKSTNKCEIINYLTRKETIDSGSFGYKQYRFLMKCIIQTDFDCSKYSAFYKTLSSKRNSIAHGEELYINKIEDCITWHNRTVQLLDDIYNSILNLSDKHL